MEPAHALSLLQYGPYYAQWDDRNSKLNVATAIRLRRTVDADVLQSAWDAVKERHPILRSTYHAGDAGPYRVVRDVKDTPPLLVRDLRGADEEQLFAHVCGEVRRPMDLSRECIRLALLSRAADDHVLLLATHQICADQTSSDIVLTELEAAYAAGASGERVRFDDVTATYDDYVAWESEFLASKRASELGSYWEHALEDAPEVILPFDRRATRGAAPVPSFEGFSVAPEVVDALRSVHGNTSMFRLLLAAYCVCLSKYTGQTDLVVATVASVRMKPEFRRLVGKMTNYLPLRIQLSMRDSYASLVQKVDRCVREASVHRDLTLVPLRNAIHGERRIEPLATTLLFAPRQIKGLSGNGIIGAPCRAELGVLSGDSYWLPQSHGEELSVICADVDGTLYGHLEFDERLFDASTMARMAHRFCAVLAACAASPNAPLRTIRIFES